MTLQEIIKYNEELTAEIKQSEFHISNLKTSLKNINTNLNLDDIKQLSYQEAKSLHKLLQYHINDIQTRIDLEIIVKELKEKEYPQLKKAHYYPVINEMDFLNDEQKNKLDSLLRRSYDGCIYTESSDFSRLKFNKETTDKVLSFLFDKGITEKSYMLKCGCGSRGDCDTRYISQEEYDLYIKYLSMSHQDIAKLSEADIEEYYEYCSIESYCEYDNFEEIDDVSEFRKKVKLFAYKNVVKPDLSLEDI